MNCSGALVFRGTRVPVSAILKDLTLNEVVEEYPAVTHDQVRVVLDFVARSADPEFPSQPLEATNAGSTR